MKFTIITHAAHKIKTKNIFAYEPYVREMNLWLKYVDEVEIVAPISTEEVTGIESIYLFKNRHSVLDTESHDLKTVENDKSIKFTKIQAFDITSLKNGITAIFKIPKILWIIYKTMNRADHIHLRCPGNIGLLACIAQIGFPSKPKTIKYAGNWDPKSKQPLSYRLQKWILSNTFLTKNAKVLVYGKWQNQTKNIVSFFTASYAEKECHPELIEGFYEASRHSQQVTERSRSVDWESHDLKTDEQMLNQVQHDDETIERHSEPSCSAGRQREAIFSKEQIASLHTPRNDGKINFLFVGALTKGKQPLLSIKVIHQLQLKGYQVQLDIYGDGVERNNIEAYIKEKQLQNTIHLHGNKPKEVIKKAYQNSHFLLFISKSEGWPKVVAEAMFWGCLPITSNVSCTPYMLDNGNRGAIVNPNVDEIISVIESYINDDKKYAAQVVNAKKWSRQFTLEKFEEEIKKILELFE